MSRIKAPTTSHSPALSRAGYADPFAALPPAASVPAGMAVYAIGDVHGRLDLLTRLMEQIRQHATTLPPEITTRRLIMLGDYIDRGPGSCQIVEMLCGPPPEGFERVCLRGNHELMMLDSLYGPEGGLIRRWLPNGGLEALDSYGVPRHSDRDWREWIPLHHRQFLENTLNMVICGDFLFAHAGVDPAMPFYRQDEQALLWIRQAFLESDRDFGKVVVHGHTIVAHPEVRSNRVGIDTGAWQSGHLTCLALHGTHREFLST